MKKFLVSKKDILSGVAKWAVAQSPYHRPDNLEIVLDKLNDKLDKDKWEDVYIYKEMSYQSIKDYLKEKLMSIPEFVLWNERKNGDGGKYKFVDRYSNNNDQDDDFIDFDALFINVANDIIRRGFEKPIPEILNDSLILIKE